MMTPLPKLTRVEVIDWRRDARDPGRSFVHWDAKSEISLSFQDEDRTLKIFIMDRAEDK